MWRGCFARVWGLSDSDGYMKWPCFERVPRHNFFFFNASRPFFFGGVELKKKLVGGAFSQFPFVRFI